MWDCWRQWDFTKEMVLIHGVLWAKESRVLASRMRKCRPRLEKHISTYRSWAVLLQPCSYSRWYWWLIKREYHPLLPLFLHQNTSTKRWILYHREAMSQCWPLVWRYHRLLVPARIIFIQPEGSGGEVRSDSLGGTDRACLIFRKSEHKNNVSPR